MKLILFGATGMIGQGVLREILLASDVDSVLAVTRTGTGVEHAKLHEIVRENFTDLSDIADQLVGYDACLYCLGVSVSGRSEQEYRRITYDYTLAAARTVLEGNPRIVFEYVSGTGTDSTETSRSLWARVKGRTENDLLRLPFHGAYMLRPSFIQPVHGERSRTPMYARLYAMTRWMFPFLKWLFGDRVTTTEELAHAMLRVAREGAAAHVLENADIVQLAGLRPSRSRRELVAGAVLDPERGARRAKFGR